MNKLLLISKSCSVITLVFILASGIIGCPIPEPPGEEDAILVPDLTGLTQAEAEDMLGDLGLVLGNLVFVHSDDHLDGVILSHTPAAGESVYLGTGIDMTISEWSPFHTTHYNADLEWDSQTWSFNSPLGLAVDSAGNLFVADSDHHRIVVSDPDGVYVTEWGQFGTENGELHRPFAIAVAEGGNVYVADTNNGRIQVFTRAGDHVATWSSYQVDENTKVEFTRIFGITVDLDGYIYAVSTDANRIDIVDSNGKFVDSWGESGSEPGTLHEPFGIGVDEATGDVYIVNTKRHRIEKFTSGGQHLLTWGESGVEAGQFRSPQGLAVDLAGNVYVADNNNNRIQKFTPDGEFLAFIGPGEFRSPHGVAVNGQGYVYVADTGNKRVVRFRPVPAP